MAFSVHLSSRLVHLVSVINGTFWVLMKGDYFLWVVLHVLTFLGGSLRKENSSFLLQNLSYK